MVGVVAASDVRRNSRSEYAVLVKTTQESKMAQPEGAAGELARAAYKASAAQCGTFALDRGAGVIDGPQRGRAARPASARTALAGAAPALLAGGGPPCHERVTYTMGSPLPAWDHNCSGPGTPGMKYYAFQIVIEKEPEDPGYFAFSPTIPGCFSNGETIEATRRNMRLAIEQHLEHL